ncbi:MAG: AAA family ATPase [Bacteroidota bacterium]
MIPIQLTLKGIYSYRDTQTIDFSRLTDAHLFGIFGPVGCGKSTILEAITYALFGQTDRLNSRGDDSNYNMMNLKSNELLIEFIFSAGSDNQEYMAIVRGKRNSRKFEEVKAFEKKAYRKTDGQWEPVDQQTIETAIGLSYENFRRTIIIPQGKFQEFLQLGNSDRTKMMKELFNLDRYDLSSKISSLDNKNNEILLNITGQLQQLEEADTHTILEKEKFLAQTKEDLLKLNGQIENMRIRNDELVRLRELTERYGNLLGRVNELEVHESEFSELSRGIQEYEQCVISFRGMIDAIDQSVNRKCSIEQQISEEEKQLEIQINEISRLNGLMETLTPYYENREEYKDRACELEKLARITDDEITLSKLQKDNLQYDAAIHELNAELEDLNGLITEKRSVLLELKKLKPDEHKIMLVKDWHSINSNLNKNQSEHEQKLNTLHNEIEKLDEERHSFCRELSLPEDTRMETLQEYISGRQAELRRELKKYDDEITHLKIQLKLEEFAQALQDGMPCPLCGSNDHPDILNIRNAGSELDNKQEIHSRTELLIESTETLMRRLSELKTRYSMLMNDLKGEEENLHRINNEIRRHQENFIWDQYHDLAEMQRALDEFRRIAYRIAEEEKELESLAVRIAAAREKMEKLKELSIAQALKYGNLKSAIDVLKTQLRLVSPAEYSSCDSSRLLAEAKEYLGRYNKIVAEYKNIEEKSVSLRRTVDTASGRVVSLKESAQLEERNIVQQKKLLNGQLKKTGYGSEGDIRNVLSRKTDDVSAEKKKAENFFKELGLLRKQLEQSIADIAGRKYEEETHNMLKQDIAELGEHINNENKKHGKLESEISVLKETLERRVKLEAELAIHRSREYNLKILKQLFKANGFVNYISTVFLQNLCLAANERFFRMTRRNLSLEITPDNNFQVRDFLNGGKTRNVKTLSGGQTFQASLSLALALADNIQSMVKSERNFFFLDEGFGSLDKEALLVVFDTLKSLRKENRIVGVISHVEEMQQEIDTHLKIKNDNENGSRIMPSWS